MAGVAVERGRGMGDGYIDGVVFALFVGRQDKDESIHYSTLSN